MSFIKLTGARNMGWHVHKLHTDKCLILKDMPNKI